MMISAKWGQLLSLFLSPHVKRVMVWGEMEEDPPFLWNTRLDVAIICHEIPSPALARRPTITPWQPVVTSSALLPLPAQSLDVIIAASFSELERLFNPESNKIWRSEVLTSFFHVLSRGGILLLTAPNPLSRPGIRTFMSSRRGCLHSHTVWHYKSMLRASGFSEVIVYSLIRSHRPGRYPVAISSLGGVAARTYFKEIASSADTFVKRAVKRVLALSGLEPFRNDTFLVVARKC